MKTRALSFPDRFEAAFVRLVMRLPHSVQRLLAGGRAVEVDGQVLHPEIQLLLALRRMIGMTSLHGGRSVRDARAMLRRDAALHAGDEIAVGRVRDLTIPGAAGPLPARHYAPAVCGEPKPLLVFFHGGGFVLCDLDTHDSACRVLCREADVHVLSVEYRKAPEHRFPAAVEDACAALAWAREHARELGADPSRVAIGGDSAGGNLATVAARLAVENGEPAPFVQLLIYPTVDRATPRRSWELFAQGFLLTRTDMDWFTALTCENERDVEHDWVSPLLWPEPPPLPPTLIVSAAFDPLRDEGEAYASVLSESGTRTRLIRVPGMVHGFINIVGTSPAALAATSEIARAFSAMLADAVQAPDASSSEPLAQSVRA